MSNERRIFFIGNNDRGYARSPTVTVKHVFSVLHIVALTRLSAFGDAVDVEHHQWQSAGDDLLMEDFLEKVRGREIRTGIAGIG